MEGLGWAVGVGVVVVGEGCLGGAEVKEHIAAPCFIPAPPQPQTAQNRARRLSVCDKPGGEGGGGRGGVSVCVEGGFVSRWVIL